MVEQSMPPACTYQGKLVSGDGAQVACTLAPDYFSGVIDQVGESIYWEPLCRFIPDAPRSQVIFYRYSDVIADANQQCAVGDFQQFEQKIQDNLQKENSQKSLTGCFEMEIAQATDWSMWQKHGGANGVINHIASVINLCQANFDNEFTNQLNLRISGTWLSSCSSCDPWPNTTQWDPLLVSFRDWGNSANGFPGISFDLGQLWTNRDMDGNTVGFAYIGAICDGFKYQWIQDYTTATNLRKTVSHEIGHNLGAGHDSAGTGTIMESGGSNNANSWSSASQNVMNPFIQGKVDNSCFFPCTPVHFEYAKVGEEGFRTRDAHEIIEKTTFTDCEPVWRYWSFNQVAGGVFVEGKSEWTFPDGTVNTDIFSDGPAPPNGWNWLRYSRLFNNLAVGTHKWKFYQKAANGNYSLMSDKTITVVAGASGLSCAERMHLPLNGNAQDISGSGNHAMAQGGAVTYENDRFGNCNAALRISGGKYLEAPVINERAVSFWFKLNQQEQMVIYDSGPSGFESKDWAIGTYKPNGIGGGSTFDNTFGLLFATWDRDIAIPFDAIKSGWHHVVVSRGTNFDQFKIAIDGQFSPGYMWDGYFTVQTWVAQTQPFTLPGGGWGVPNLFVPTYKTYLGKDFENTQLWGAGLAYFDGWLDEVRVFNQLLDDNEMLGLYNAPNDNPNNASASSSQPTYCEGQNIQFNASATGAVSYSWSGPGNFTSSQQNPVRSNATTAMAGTYSVTITLGGGCTVVKTVSVGVTAKPNASITSVVPACGGQNNGAATVTASGGSSYGYAWSNGQTTQTATNLTAGTYTVTVTASGGCTATASATITGIPATMASFTFSINNQTVSFTNTSTNANLPWNFGNNQTSTQSNPRTPTPPQVLTMYA
ncbi:MAG: hypothetical protein IPM82_20620 [Saprospiraceae bacterium]|nr:hypothetical protein [Saprospiraceae bacterium]